MGIISAAYPAPRDIVYKGKQNQRKCGKMTFVLEFIKSS